MSKAGEIELYKTYKTSYWNNNKHWEAHIENFKNLKDIAKAKGEQLTTFKNGTVILNHDDKFFDYLKLKAKLRNLKIVSFGMNKMSDVNPISIKNLQNKIINKDQKSDFDLEVKILIFTMFFILALLNELNLNIKKLLKTLAHMNQPKGEEKFIQLKDIIKSLN